MYIPIKFASVVCCSVVTWVTVVSNGMSDVVVTLSVVTLFLVFSDVLSDIDVGVVETLVGEVVIIGVFVVLVVKVVEGAIVGDVVVALVRVV